MLFSLMTITHYKQKYMFAAMRPMKKLQYRLTLQSRENSKEDRYNDGVEGHPASSTLFVTPDKNGYICILWKKALKSYNLPRLADSGAPDQAASWSTCDLCGMTHRPWRYTTARQISSTSLLTDEIKSKDVHFARTTHRKRVNWEGKWWNYSGDLTADARNSTRNNGTRGLASAPLNSSHF